MNKRRTEFFRKPEPGFFLAFAFLIWSLLPHFQLVVHIHPGDGDGHRHTVLSGSQVELADRMAMALAASGEETRPADFSGEAVRSPVPESGLPALAPERGSLAHAHYQEDINASALILDLPEAVPAPGTDAFLSASHQAPDLAVRRAYPARGPPESPSA